MTDGFAFFTAALTSSFSLLVNAVTSSTGTFSTGFNPANASVSYESTFPFLLLSWCVTTRSPAWNFSSPDSVTVILPSFATEIVRFAWLLSYPVAVFVNCISTPRIATCNLSPVSTVVFGLIVTVLSSSLNVVMMSTGLTSKTGTVTSFVELSEYVNTTVATFLPPTSVIRPLSLRTLVVGCGWLFEIAILLITLLDSVAGTTPCAFLSFAALIETSWAVNVAFDLFACFASIGSSTVSEEPSGYVTVADT